MKVYEVHVRAYAVEFGSNTDELVTRLGIFSSFEKAKAFILNSGEVFDGVESVNPDTIGFFEEFRAEGFSNSGEVEYNYAISVLELDPE